jgi:hypothetical protein
MLETQLLIDFITGQLGSHADQATAAAIVRVVIAGNLVCSRVHFAVRCDSSGQSHGGDRVTGARQAQDQGRQRRHH